jgi:hypothetical protein
MRHIELAVLKSGHGVEFQLIDQTKWQMNMLDARVEICEIFHTGMGK